MAWYAGRKTHRKRQQLLLLEKVLDYSQNKWNLTTVGFMVWVKNLLRFFHHTMKPTVVKFKFKFFFFGLKTPPKRNTYRKQLHCIQKQDQVSPRSMTVRTCFPSKMSSNTFSDLSNGSARHHCLCSCSLSLANISKVFIPCKIHFKACHVSPHLYCEYFFLSYTLFQNDGQFIILLCAC